MSLAEAPTKSLNDKKSYRVIKLENGLTALLVSDLTPCNEDYVKNTSDEDSTDEDIVYCAENNLEDSDNKSQGPKLAAAALNIGIGSFHEPDDIPGLAHLLEHMIFMGSEKYHEEPSFESFMARRGGFQNPPCSNAGTTCESTKFYFKINKKYLYNTLDRFAQCFISPLLKLNAFNQEIEVLENEYKASMQLDDCRRNQLLGSLTAINGHPMGKFTLGNCDSLKIIPLANGIDVHSRLIEFRKQYYVSNAMNLVIQSQDTLDTLEEWVKELFSQIPSGAFESTYSNLSEPFNTPEFRKFYKIASVGSNNLLFLTWAFPSMDKNYKDKSLAYISHLIGHEGKGSLLSYLKQKIWALHLWTFHCYSDFLANSTCYLFCFSIELTDSGVEHLYEVLSGVFSYIAMLKRVGPIERTFEEIKLIELAEFNWSEESEAIENVRQFAEHMQKCSVEDYINGGSIHFYYNKSFIQDCLNKLNPDDVNVMLISKHHNTESFNAREPWYQTLYQANDINSEWINQFKNIEPLPDFFLPIPNNFIATDFTIKHDDIYKNEGLIKILNTSQGCLWYKHDIKFNVPKAIIMFHLKSPLIQISLLNSVLEELFITCLKQNLQEDVYPASLALLDYYVDIGSKGLILNVSGFNHKLEVLLETLVDHIAQFDITDDLFEVVKIKIEKQYYDSCIDPSNLAGIVTDHIIRDTYWSPIMKRKLLNDITKDLVIQFAKDLTRRLYIDCLCQGNISSEESLKLFKLMETKLQCVAVQPEEFLKNRLMKIPQGRTYCRVLGINSDDESSFVDNYFQCGLANIYSECQLELLIDFMVEPCFNFLRTQEQLSNVVYCQCLENDGTYGFRITVHSSTGKFSCSEIDRKIEEFLIYFRIFLNDITEEEFEDTAAGMISFMEQPHIHLQDAVGKNTTEIIDGDYLFDRNEVKINCMKSITLKEFRDFFNIGKEECLNFNKLSVQVMAGCNATSINEDDSEVTNSINSITSKLKYMYMAINDNDISQSNVIMDIESFKEKLEIFSYA